MGPEYESGERDGYNKKSESRPSTEYREGYRIGQQKRETEEFLTLPGFGSKRGSSGNWYRDYLGTFTSGKPTGPKVEYENGSVKILIFFIFIILPLPFYAIGSLAYVLWGGFVHLLQAAAFWFVIYWLWKWCIDLKPISVDGVPVEKAEPGKGKA